MPASGLQGVIAAAKGVPGWLDPLILMANELLAVADGALKDAESDEIATECARKLGAKRLRDGHFRAIRAHLRAIEKGMGPQWVADYLDALRMIYEGPLIEADEAEAKARDDAAWERDRAAIKTRRPAASREEIEARVGN